MQRPATRRVIYPQVKLTLYILELDKEANLWFYKTDYDRYIGWLKNIYRVCAA